MKENNNASKKKEFFLFRWARRMFMGASKDLVKEADHYDSPSVLAFKRFFRRPTATISVVVLVAMFAFVLIGPLFAPVDLSYSEMLHCNVAPTMSLMKIPSSMKEGTSSISSMGSFSLGLDDKGDVHVWGYYGASKGAKNTSKNVMNIPEEVENANILFAAAGIDHCVAISDEGKVYCWGEYDQGQYGLDGSMIAAARKEPIELIEGTINVANVRQLICGYQVTAILMNDGTIYGWGNDAVGARNLGKVITQAKKLEDSKIVKLCLTNSYIYAITDKGEFLRGGAKNFDLVTEKETTDEHTNGRKIVDIASTTDSITLLYEDGEVLSIGLKDDSTKVPAIDVNDKVISISAGSRHYTMMTENGKAYAWGNGKLGQLDVPSKLQKDGAVDEIISSGFQNYAFKDGKYVGSWGLKGYVFGTDDMGRDVFNRVMNGGKMTMTIGAVSVIVAAIIGIIVGCISGYFGGWVDMLLMRVTEIFSAIPFLPFALVLSAILQASNLKEDYKIFIIMVILGLLSWTGLAHLIRGQVLAEREKEFVTAAKAMGVKEGRIAFKHILPNIVSVILVTLTLDFASCMLTESSLSYLGFGVQLPRPTWGNMLYGCNNSVVIKNYWWRWVFPAIFLSITVICINIIGDTLRDVLDPKSEVDK